MPGVQRTETLISMARPAMIVVMAMSGAVLIV